MNIATPDFKLLFFLCFFYFLTLSRLSYVTLRHLVLSKLSLEGMGGIGGRKRVALFLERDND